MTYPIIQAAACTHIGRVRSRNEDAVLADARLGLVAVADGLGGRNAGDMASRLAIESLSQSLATLASSGERSPPIALHEAFTRANAHVYAMSTRIPGCAGMGTTLVAGWFVETPELGLQLIVAHVGDSRLYRYRAQSDPALCALTRDHTSAQQLIDEGLYSAGDARLLPQRHILTNALGVDAEIDLDLMTTPVLAGDLILLCSDGLSNMLDDSQILALLDAASIHGASLSNEAELRLLAQNLIDTANERGGQDNISVVLATPVIAKNQT